MFTISQIVGHPLDKILECVWLLSDGKLTCVWVERTFQTEAGEYAQDQELDLNQRVA
jgi:hypothetical protein